jgi:hypothetical protein
MTSYAFPTDATDGDKVRLDNGCQYIYQADKDRWMVNALNEADPCIKCTAVATGYQSSNGQPQICLDYQSFQDVTIMTLRGFDEYPPDDVEELTLNDDVYPVDKVVLGNNNHDYWFTGNLKTPYVNNELTVKHCPEPIEYATLEHSDGRDDALQIKIDELEQEIDIIAPRLDGAQYTYAASHSVKPGEMFIASNSFTAATDIVLFNDVALDGTTHAWGSLNEGDYLEITDTQERSGRTAENYAMYLCTKDPEGTGLKQIEVALVKGSGAPTVGDVLDAKGFELGGNDINDLDARYELKQSHRSLYRSMKLESKHYSANNYNEIVAKANTLIMSGQGFNTSQGIIMRDLDGFYPPDKYEFVPGMVTAMEPYISGGASWEIEQPAAVWVWWAYDVKEWSETRQRIQGTPLWFGNAKNQGKYPSSEFTYQISFQCFRRK